MVATLPLPMADAVSLGVPAIDAARTRIDVDELVVTLFRQEASSLVRLTRLFVDDRNAAEDLVQEAFIRLSRNAHRIEDPAKAPAYLRPPAQRMLLQTAADGLAILELAVNWEAEKLYGVEGLGPFDEF